MYPGAYNEHGDHSRSIRPLWKCLRQATVKSVSKIAYPRKPKQKNLARNQRNNTCTRIRTYFIPRVIVATSRLSAKRC